MDSKVTRAMLGVVAIAWSGIAAAVPIMHVHDSAGTLATVDAANGNVSIIGSMGVTMTDIAFDPTGNLFGLDFGNFYSINPLTAATTLIGSHGIPTGNALVFDSAGTLYGAGASSTSLFTINPASGASTNLGTTGFASGGDLAFNGGNFFLATSSNVLANIDLSNLGNSAAVGPFGVGGVFGLASSETGVLYAVAGTTIYTVNPATGATSAPVSFAGQGLGTAFGQSFFLEAAPPPPPPAGVPEPSTTVLLTVGFLGVGIMRRRRVS